MFFPDRGCVRPLRHLSRRLLVLMTLENAKRVTRPWELLVTHRLDFISVCLLISKTEVNLTQRCQQ